MSDMGTGKKKTLFRKQLGVQAVLIVRRRALPRMSVHGGETTGHEISQKLNDKVLSSFRKEAQIQTIHIRELF